MFFCCCDATCGLFSDDFTDDHVELWYDQIAGTWTDNEGGGFMETLDSSAVLRLNATNSDESATVILFADIRVMTAGDVIRLCLGMTEDGSGYMYAEITDTGDCGEAVLGSTEGGVLSRTIHLGKTSDGSSYYPLFLAYDGEWLHFGGASGTTATTIAAVQVTAPGIYAGVGTGSIGAIGVRFDQLSLNNYRFDDDGSSPTGACFTHVVPCGYGGTDACYPDQPSCSFPWTDSADGFQCPALVTSGAFWLQSDGDSADFQAAYRSDGDSKVVNGYPVPFQGDDMTAKLSVWYQAGATGKVRLYVDADAAGEGGAYAEFEILATSGSGTLQLFSGAGVDLTAAVEVNTGVDTGSILQVQRDGSYLRAQLSTTSGGVQAAIAAICPSWQDGGYSAAETVDVSGNIATNFPGCWASEAESHPTIRPGDSECYGPIQTDCRTCTSTAETIRDVTVSMGGALAMTSSPMAGQDDGGCCANITGTFALDINDIVSLGATCVYERDFSWCYTKLFTPNPSAPAGDGDINSAIARIRVSLSATGVEATISLIVGYNNGGVPASTSTIGDYSVTTGSDPREACDQAFALTLDSVSVVGPASTWELCEGFSGLDVSVEFSS